MDDKINHWQSAWSLLVLLAPLLVIANDYILYVVFGRQATLTYAIQSMARQWQELPWFAASAFVWLWLHLFAKIVLDRMEGK